MDAAQKENMRKIRMYIGKYSQLQKSVPAPKAPEKK